MVLNILLIVSLIIAGLLSSGIFVISLWVYYQRRTRPYLLLSIALAALASRSVVGGLYMADFLLHAHHHLIEHVFDMVIAICLLVAIVSMGQPGAATEDRVANE